MNVMNSFREILASAKHILILTGSGISAESGIPTFRGAGGFWRKYQAQSLATPEAFKANPSLVWEFYEYRRTVAKNAQPNKVFFHCLLKRPYETELRISDRYHNPNTFQAHEAIANFQKRLSDEGRTVTIVTQNIDGLHQRAGAKDVLELHGSLYQTRCTKCKDINSNDNVPICPALAGKWYASEREKIFIINIYHPFLNYFSNKKNYQNFL